MSKCKSIPNLKKLLVSLVHTWLQKENPRRNGGCLPKLTAYENLYILYYFYFTLKEYLQIRCQKISFNVKYFKMTKK